LENKEKKVAKRNVAKELTFDFSPIRRKYLIEEEGRKPIDVLKPGYDS